MSEVRPSLDDQMALAIRAMAHHAGEASRVDRRGWTDAQWIEDANRLMNDLDGSVSSLVNGHVMALLQGHDDLRAQLAATQIRLHDAEQTIAAVTRERDAARLALAAVRDVWAARVEGES